MDTPAPAPMKLTPDKTDGLWPPVEIPEAEIRYVPSGTRHVPPPASATDFKAAVNAAVSFVTPSPTAPYVLTLTACPFSGIGLLIAVRVRGTLGFVICPLVEG